MRNPFTAVGRYCITLALLALPVGCMATRPILSDGPVPLRENEGIVVLHVDTDTAIAAVSISGLHVLKNLPSGRHVSLHVLTAGRYSFSTLITGNSSWSSRYPLYRLGDERLRFNVRPGEISYPGLLLVRRASSEYGPALYVRSFSRAGQALSALRDEYPEILDRYPIVNGRVNRDDFLEFFQAEP